MAESITEGTLKSWSKRENWRCLDQSFTLNLRAEIGDHVEQDEEIATIETDKVNSEPMSAKDVQVIISADRRLSQCTSGRHDQGVLSARRRYC